MVCAISVARAEQIGFDRQAISADELEKESGFVRRVFLCRGGLFGASGSSTPEFPAESVSAP